MIDHLPWYRTGGGDLGVVGQLNKWSDDEITRSDAPRRDVGFIPLTNVGDRAAATVVVNILAARSPIFAAAPSGFTFYRSNSSSSHTTLDEADAITDILLGGREPVGSIDGSTTYYSYVYVIQLDSDQSSELWFAPIDDIVGFEPWMVAAAYRNVGSLEAHEFEAHGETEPTFDVGAEVVDGFWVNAVGAAFDDPREEPPNELSSDVSAVTIGQGTPTQILDLGWHSDPDPITWSVTSSEAFDIRSVYLHLRPTPPPSTVTLPDLTAAHSFVATLDTIGGQRRGLPPITATHQFDGAATVAASGTDWRAVLVNAQGDTIHQMPDADIGPIEEVLNDITHGTVTIPLRSVAGSAIDEASTLPELEVQVWRGNVLHLWGPVVADPTVNGDHVRLDVRDAPWHLTQRHVGEPGGTFGGRPPYYHDAPDNLRFQRGDLTGWGIIRTVTIGEFVGFGIPDPDAIRLAPETHLPSGEPMARCVSPLDPLDNYQLFQDLRIRGPQNGRPLKVTLSGWWFIPSDGNYAPNNQRMGLLLATLLDDANLPSDYYRPTDWAFTDLDDTAPRDRLFYQECALELPPGVPTTVHASVCFPQGVTFMGGLDLTVDDGLLYDESPTTIGAGLVIHAQDAEFARDDVALDWWANTLGDREVREFVFNDHANIMEAITGLAREGWFDWWCSYRADRRVMNFQARRRGTHRPACTIHATDGGPTNVAAISRKRTTGATVVAAQMRSRTEGSHEHAARTDGLVLEELFVAGREPVDFDLPAIATERLALTGRPWIIEVDGLPGDERWLLGIEMGDTVDITSTVPGGRATGRHRLTARTIDPTTDTVHLTFHPEP